VIASLHGEVISIGLDHAVIECGGVGYKFLATANTLAQLQREHEARVLTSLVVKEDSMTLFGFFAPEDREMFHLLQSVSGLGPKLAMAALSVMNAGDLAAAIAAADSKRLQSVPGVGKRMAERMALELKDKVAAFSPVAPSADLSQASGAPAVLVEQVTEALLGLGFSEKASRPVVEAIAAEQPEAATAEVLRAALSQLGRKK